jgi:hypothetical protein
MIKLWQEFDDQQMGMKEKEASSQYRIVLKVCVTLLRRFLLGTYRAAETQSNSILSRSGRATLAV